MTKYSQEQKEILLQNSNIIKVTNSTITFEPDFMIEVANAVSLTKAREVFAKHEMPMDIIGEGRFEKSYYRWRNSIRYKGVGSFRTESRGRKPSTDTASYESLSSEEKIVFLEKQLASDRKEIEFLKKYMPSSHKSKIKNKDWYQAIYKAKSDDGDFVPHTILKSLGLNSSGYYNYVHRIDNPSEKSFHDRCILADIEYIQSKFKNKFGYRRIKMELDTLYDKCNISRVNHKRIIRIMNENEIFCVVRKKKAYKDSWESTKEDRVCANKLNRVFDVGSPREILLTDITYLHCLFGTAYLSAVKDCITKEIIAFVIKDNMKIGLSLDVVSQLSKLHLHTDAYVHSDQGIHYTSKQFRNDLIRCGIGQSMSRRGKCIDNAPMESFFGHFKDEVDYEDCKNLEELIYKINEYMVYYNHQRKQWNLKKMTPVQYRYHLLEQAA